MLIISTLSALIDSHLSQMTFPLFADYALHLLALQFSTLKPFTLTILHTNLLKYPSSFLGNHSILNDSAAGPAR